MKYEIFISYYFMLIKIPINKFVEYEQVNIKKIFIFLLNISTIDKDFQQFCYD